MPQAVPTMLTLGTMLTFLASSSIPLSSAFGLWMTPSYGRHRFCPSSQQPHANGPTCRRSTILFAKRKKNSSIEIPPNEFSRTVQPDRILKIGSSRANAASDYTSNGINSGFALTIEADESERKSLAQRFSLSQISSLSADLVLRSCSRGSSSSSSNTGGSVEVEGTCKATVTQRCVRTNDDFAVDLEFPLYCIVRPAFPAGGTEQASLDSMADDQQPDQSQRKGKSTNRQNNVDLGEMQRLLEKSIRNDRSYTDENDDDDTLMEDDSIYCVDGPLDVGELVSQLFWLKLDPYPKKPGTSPVQRSITG